MPFLTQGKTNTKYISIVIILAMIVVGILTWQYHLMPKEEVKVPIAKEAFIKVLSPNGGEQWITGKKYDITWQTNNVDKIFIYLVKEGASDVAEIVVSSSQASLGKYSWTIPSNNNDINLGGQFKIMISSEENNSIIDGSDDYFTIIKDETADWKTYNNEGYGYEVKYPKDWSISIKVKDVSYMCQEHPEYNCLSYIQFFPPSTKDYSLINLVVYGNLWRKEGKTVETDGCEATHNYLSNGDYLFDLSTCIGVGQEKTKEVYDQMLSTSKFIDTKETKCYEWRQECGKEGEHLCNSCGCKENCCTGLVRRQILNPNMNANHEYLCMENPDITDYICTKCGDKICGKGENWCICAQDCPSPEPQP